MSPGETKIFRFYVPDDIFYSVETMKYGSTNVDTVLEINNLSSGSIIDDDSGSYNYSFLEFSHSGGYIIVSLYSSYSSGDFYLQIRRQQAVLYGFNYSVIGSGNDTLNTIPDLSYPYNYLCYDYFTYKFETQRGSHFLGYDNRGIKRYNSEIVFFSGHRNSLNPYIVFVKENSGIYEYSYVSIDQITEMTNTKVAVLSSCYSAKIYDGYVHSLASKCVVAGAKSSLGFKESINNVSARIFTNALFNQLANGNTLQSSATYANTLILWPYDNIHQYLIFGNSNTVIANSVRCLQSNEVDLDLINKYDFFNDINRLSLWSNSDFNRYFFTVNGYLTNMYIDIISDNNNNIISTKGNLDLFDYYNLIIEPITIRYELCNNSHLVYIIDNNVATPVLINYNIKKTGDIEEEIVECVNLNDGSKIDYESICTIYGGK